MRSSPRSLALATALVTGMLGLSACAGNDTGPDTTPSATTSAAPLTASDPNAKVTLTWWTGQQTEAEKLLEDKAKAFSALHPNVSIEVSSGASTTDELLQKVSAAFAAGTYPDVSYAFGSWASELGASGRTLDITGNLGEADLKWTELPEAARETAQPGGRTIAIPALVDNLALFYNKTVFDEAGLAYPTNDWTWDQFREAAKKLTNASKNIFGTSFDVSGAEGTTWAMWPQLWQNGGSVLSADEKSAAFNSEAGVKAVQFWRDLAVTDKSVYLDQTEEKAGPLFYSNNIGMYISGPWVLYDLGQAKTKYGVVNLPGTNGNHQTVSGPDLWVLFDHKDANRAYWSYQLVKWLTSPEQDLGWNVAFGNLPLRTSEMSTPEFKAKAAEAPGYQLLAENLANATTKRPTVPGYVGLSKAFGEAVAKILQGQGEVQATLDAAKAKADAALAGQ